MCWQLFCSHGPLSSNAWSFRCAHIHISMLVHNDVNQALQHMQGCSTQGQATKHVPACLNQHKRRASCPSK